MACSSCVGNYAGLAMKAGESCVKGAAFQVQAPSNSQPGSGQRSASVYIPRKSIQCFSQLSKYCRHQDDRRWKNGQSLISDTQSHFEKSHISGPGARSNYRQDYLQDSVSNSIRIENHVVEENFFRAKPTEIVGVEAKEDLTESCSNNDSKGRGSVRTLSGDLVETEQGFKSGHYLCSAGGLVSLLPFMVAAGMAVYAPDGSAGVAIDDTVMASTASITSIADVASPSVLSSWLGMVPEPSNALSLPTWTIHVASVVEWVAAMGLVWEYGGRRGREAWRGLAWGMVPSLGGAMCACTWHFFYNAPALEALVALQGFLTLLGNCTLWYAAFRIWQRAQPPATGA
eukprot:TRINITY_DN5832_c0_g1_i1.p1 TRINITY_DN5832_c0_g1~~TRINITY_DN5832_c0_g1_i1.p1  ORF type:complete len:343 (+),score=32.94 TRINITY_DN5832_c0_g1_i1:260-1288(+)